jgi:glycosyltransferase involved in cell wall biosynthesis
VTTPKVSICIPAYRQPEFFERALQSCFNQDFTDYEIIVTDDSLDQSVEEIARKHQGDPRLKYYKNATSLGSPQNWNESVNRASGEYIKILHHDDWLLKSNSLSSFVDLLDKHPQADFAFSGNMHFDSQGRPKNERAISAKQVATLRKRPTRLIFGNSIGAPSVTIYRKSLNIGYDPELKWLVDLDFYIKCLLKNPNFAFTPDRLIGVTIGSDHQVTSQCVDNIPILVFEHLHMYNNFKGKVSGNDLFTRLWNVLADYRIETDEALKDCKIPATEINSDLKTMMNSVKIYRRTAAFLTRALSPTFWARLFLRSICSRIV